MAGSPERFQTIKGGRFIDVVGKLVRSWRAWGVIALLVAISAVVPTVAKAPLAIFAGVGLLAPLIHRLPARPGNEDRFADPSIGVRFPGFMKDRGPSATGRWRQYRFLVDGSRLEATPYWSPGRAEVITIKGAWIRSIRSSDRSDRNLKSDLMRIIYVELADGTSLSLAVGYPIEHQVLQLLQARA